MEYGLLRRAGWVVVSGAMLGLGGALPAWGQDTTPPTAPSGLTATTVGAGRISLTWTGSTDNVTPAASIWYRISVAEAAEDLDQAPDFFFVQGGVNGQGIRKHPLTQTYGGDDNVLRPLVPGTTYFIRVEAFDVPWNRSDASNTASATTLLVKRLTGVTVEEAAYVRDVLHRGWSRSRNAGVSGKALVRAGYSFDTETAVSGSDWIVNGFLTAQFELQGLLTAGDLCCVSYGASSNLTVRYLNGRLTAEISPAATNESNYAGKVKGVTGFSSMHDRDSSGGFFGHSTTSFTQTNTITASVVAKGLPAYLMPELELVRTEGGSVRLAMGHRWYSEVDLVEQVTGVNRTDVTMTWKKKKRSLFHSSTKTKTVETMELVPFQTRLTTKSVCSIPGDPSCGLRAGLNIDTGRQRLDLANPGKIFPAWLPMHADLTADLDWSVTVDANPLKLVLADHGVTDGPALEGTVREVGRCLLFPDLGLRLTWVRYYGIGGEGLHVVGLEIVNGSEPRGRMTGTRWLLAWMATLPPPSTLFGPFGPTHGPSCN